jgi:predicted aspartyl protease
LPFEAGDEPNRVLVNLAPPGGRPFLMMLDTGASDSVVTPLMARELGVRVRKLKTDAYRRATRLGRDLQFYVDTRRSDTGSSTGWEYGLLGAEFLNDYVLEIDFPGRQVRFLDPKKYEVPEQVEAADERVLKVKLTSSRPLVPIRVNGNETTVMLDTGDPGTGVLSGKAARELGIDVAALPSFGSVGTVIGEMRTLLYEEPSFAFAGFPLGAVALLVAPKGWYNQGGPNDSTVGYDVLAPFVIRIDYPRKRLWLKRLSHAPISFGGADYALAKQTGAYMSPVGEGWAVWAVIPSTPAEKIGLRIGDVIVSPAGATPPTPDEVLRQIRKGKELQVARKQGELWVDTVLPEAPPAN